MLRDQPIEDVPIEDGADYGLEPGDELIDDVPPHVSFAMPQSLSDVLGLFKLRRHELHALSEWAADIFDVHALIEGLGSVGIKADLNVLNWKVTIDDRWLFI